MDSKNLELFAVGNCLMVVVAAVVVVEELYEIPLGVLVDDHLYHFDGTMVGCLTFVVAVWVGEVLTIVVYHHTHIWLPALVHTSIY